MKTRLAVNLVNYSITFSDNEYIAVCHSAKKKKKKNTIQQVNTMLSTSKNVLFPGHNHLITTGTDDPTL